MTREVSVFRRATPVALLVSALLAVPTAAVAGHGHAERPPAPSSGSSHDHPVVLFGADGMRPDLMQKYAREGRMPTYASLMRQGATGANGLTQGFPPNTGQGWYTLATGAWPGVHGSTNNTFFDNRQPFTASDSFSFHGNGAGPGTDPTNVLEAQSVASAAEAAGKTVAQVDFTGGLNANINGPTVDYDTFYSTRGVLETPADATKQAGAAKFGLSYQVAAFTPATGWSNVPASARPAQQTQLLVKSSSAAVNPDRVFDVYVYAAGAGGYDRALLVPAGDGKDGGQAAATLVPGKYSPVKITLTGAAAGETAGFYVKLMTLAPDLSRFGLYFTSVTRANAHCATAACDALPAGAPGEDKLAKYINDHLPPAVFGDFAPEESGLVDEDTWFEQTVGLNHAYESAVLKYVLTELQPDTDVLLAGTDETDEVSHQIIGLLTRTAPDGSSNPYYDRVKGTGPRDGRIQQREAYLAGAYASADAQLGLVRRYLGSDADILASADHGFAPQWLAIDGALPLKQLGLQDVEQTGNCRPAAASAPGGTVAKQCEAGGTSQIYLSLKGRNPDGVLPAADYGATVQRIVDAYRSLTDPATGQEIIEKVLTKAQMADVDGSDSLNPTRTGDVVVIAKPPYQFDGATVGTLVAPSLFFGQHGYLPDQVDLAHNINMHAAFVAGGPDVAHRDAVTGVRAVDLAPTLAVLGGFDPPLQAQGRVLTSILKRGQRYVTGQLLGINDVHGNITGKGLTQTDPFTGVKDAAGGLGVLATYLKQARAEERNTVTVEAGDMVGASPPESALLRDKPTLDALDLMHVDVGTLGNHEFDRGVPEMLRQVNGGRSTVDPSVRFDGLDFPVVDANVISNATGRPLLRPYVVRRVGGVPVAFIGATTVTTPSIVTTGGTDGVHFTAEATAINGYVRQLQRQGVHAFVAVIHEGGTQTTYPVGTVGDPIAAITRKLDPAVKVVIAGHSHTVLDARIGGRLVVQASSYSRAFDQVHLLLDRRAGTIAASWGRVRMAWQAQPPRSTDPLGTPVTPDPRVQAVVDAAVQATNPVTQEVINHAAADVPSQREGGATPAGESPAGDLIADAQRAYAGTQLAFVNTGSVRAGLLAGPVTYGALFTMQPFQDDYLDTFTLTGAQVWDLLGQQLAAGTGGIMQVSGLHFTYTGTQVAGSITGVWLGSPGDSSTPIPDSDSVTYTGTANSFMVGGGDGFTVLEKAGDIVQTADAELVPLVAYVRGLSDPFTYATDGRIAIG
ncbi:5'-nucleotidase C-terminal domain-containing protein [Nocardioides sp. CER19]|uniref:5'-nucleotidase C-terminal domain-containing protein n=1 Tax=Nocardioides sp. CER19 TaxID=3038538 RepID=UPI002447D19F|nr:5'-nucleotidase C-terminal domain-containing protein [Nocardioides sp. CER19]MDH2415717.1 alkaline phosphatase family protein [Nocardioides sp. CER19]